MTLSTYLDYNATAPVRPAVATAVAAALRIGGNASSVHRAGRLARRRIEDARESVAALVGAAPADVVFTSGGTEANNLALRGCGRPRVAVSAVEHDSVRAASEGVETIPVDENGVVKYDAVEDWLSAGNRPALVSVMLANNETGVIQPVAEIAELAHRHGALMHTDAVQAAGKMPIDMVALGVDLLSLSAHKLGGPQGIGALIASGGTDLTAILQGGGQERGRRAGTENLPGIAGFGVAAETATHEAADQSRTTALRDDIESRLLAGAPEARVLGAAVPRLANTSCITMPGVEAETQVMALDLAGVMVSAGAACSSGKVQMSHVLIAMGLEPALAATAIRVSLGWDSSGGDVDAFIATWMALFVRSREIRPATAA